MGFTPLEGLVMATRAGNTDPGLLVWLLQRGPGSAWMSCPPGWSSGPAWPGWPGWPTSGTCCPARAAATPSRSWLWTCTCTGCASSSRAWPPPWTGSTCCCSPAASASTSRRSGPGPRRASSAAAIDEQRNQAASSDADISAPGAAVRTLVITAREDIEIARQVRATLT